MRKKIEFSCISIKEHIIILFFNQHEKYKIIRKKTTCGLTNILCVKVFKSILTQETFLHPYFIKALNKSNSVG